MSNADKQFVLRAMLVVGKSLIWALGLFVWVISLILAFVSNNMIALAGAMLGIPFLTYVTTQMFELGIRSHYPITLLSD